MAFKRKIIHSKNEYSENPENEMFQFFPLKLCLHSQKTKQNQSDFSLKEKLINPNNLNFFCQFYWEKNILDFKLWTQIYKTQ